MLYLFWELVGRLRANNYYTGSEVPPALAIGSSCLFNAASDPSSGSKKALLHVYMLYTNIRTIGCR